ncbi:MAG: GNAT family N-acetyltransferase [Nocardioidaceae bacterium]
MPELVRPDPRYQRSFLEAVNEIRALDEDERYCGLTIIGQVGDFEGEFFPFESLHDVETFAAYTRRLRELALPTTWLPESIVPATTLWWVDGEEYLGRLSIRHSLTPWLFELGGHIGYVVRPTARRKGSATAMLIAALPIVHSLGIDPVLVTCDNTNEPSRKVIETAGGVFEDQREDKLRFWVPTGR